MTMYSTGVRQEGLAWIFIATASRALLPGQRVMRDTTLRILVFSWGFASHMAINEDCKGETRCLPDVWLVRLGSRDWKTF